MGYFPFEKVISYGIQIPNNKEFAKLQRILRLASYKKPCTWLVVYLEVLFLLNDNIHGSMMLGILEIQPT